MRMKFGFWTFFAVIAVPGMVLAVGAPGTVTSADGKRFEVEGNLLCGDSTPASNVGDDWAPPSTSSSASVPPGTVQPCPSGTTAVFTGTGSSETNASEIAAFRFRDTASSSSDDIFGNGSKQEDTSTWAYVTGSAPAKSDIGNVYALGRMNGTLDSVVAITGFERLANNGSTHLDYELNQLPFVTNANGALAANRCTAAGDPDPRCTQADIIIAIDDGTTIVPDVQVYKWVGDPISGGLHSGSKGTFVQIAFGDPAAQVFAATNSSGPIPAGPWGAYNKGKLVYNTASSPNPVLTDIFSETAINLKDVGVTVGCPQGFSTLFIKSRASSEVNSALKDMVFPPIPFGLNTCGVLTINKMNTSDPDHVVPLPGATFVVSPDPSTGIGSLTVTDGGTGDLDGVADGVIMFDRAKPATYTVTETASPLNQVPLPPAQVCVLSSKGTCTVTFNNTGKPDLSTSFKSASPASSTSVSSGQTITYTVTYINTGNAPALSTVITDVVDLQLTSVVPLNGGNFNAATRTITWNVGDVAPGAMGTVSFTAQVVAPLSNTTIFNTATIMASNATTVVTNTTHHPVGPPVLSLVKSVNKATAIPGETLIYTLNYSNTGGGDATNVVISDTLPTKTTFVSATNGGTVANGAVTWNIGTLLHGASGSVSFTVQLDAVFPSGTTPVTNSGILTSVQIPTTPSNQVTTAVNASPNLAVTKSLASSVQRTLANFTNTAKIQGAEDQTGKSESELIPSVVKGTDVTYTIAYSNSGNADATSVVITDALPMESLFVSASGGGVESNGVVTWNIGTVAANGGSGSVTLVIRVGL